MDTVCPIRIPHGVKVFTAVAIIASQIPGTPEVLKQQCKETADNLNEKGFPEALFGFDISPQDYNIITRDAPMSMTELMMMRARKKWLRNRPPDEIPMVEDTEKKYPIRYDYRSTHQKLYL